MDQIQTVSGITEACREYNLALVLTFVDYEKVFDSTETNAILSALVDQLMDGSHVKPLVDFYKDCLTTVQFFYRFLLI